MSRPRSRQFAFPSLYSAARFGALGLAALCSAGCAQRQSAYAPPAHVRAPAPPQAHGAWVAKVEIEDDGLPSQLAPRHRAPVKDDPSEPWSPNYGKPSTPAPTPPHPARSAATTVDDMAKRRLAAPQQVSGMDEEAIIRRAIAEHEMRRRD